LKKRFNIKILGHEISVLSDAREEHVADVVRYVNDKAAEIERTIKNLTTLNTSLLVTLNIADDYLKLKGEKEDIFDQLESKSERLLNFIDESM
jgi:cell division protein ZapA (FtsZ GTPase activity inhibitor)